MKKLVRSVENNRPVPFNVADFGLPFYLNPNQKAELFISEIAENKPDTESVSENPESKWFEVGGLPPAGAEFEAYFAKDTSPSWSNGTVAYASSIHTILIFDDGEEHHYQTVDLMKIAKFRPIRTEREKFIYAAEAAFKVSGFDKLTDFGFLYDAGFRLPESK